MRDVSCGIDRGVYWCFWRASRMVILVTVVRIFCGWVGFDSRDRGAGGENVACFDGVEGRGRMLGSIRVRLNAVSVCACGFNDKSADELGICAHRGWLLPCGEQGPIRKC